MVSNRFRLYWAIPQFHPRFRDWMLNSQQVCSVGCMQIMRLASFHSCTVHQRNDNNVFFLCESSLSFGGKKKSLSKKESAPRCVIWKCFWRLSGSEHPSSQWQVNFYILIFPADVTDGISPHLNVCLRIKMYYTVAQN